MKEVERLRESIIGSRNPNRLCIAICGGTGCLVQRAADVIAGFRWEIQEQGLNTKVDLRITGCPGFCQRGPLVLIEPENIKVSS
jgi:NADH-quinone oxidoreductase subunit F